MAISFRNRLFGNNSTSASKNKNKRNRSLRIEELESRDLLSATPFETDWDKILPPIYENEIVVVPASEPVQTFTDSEMLPLASNSFEPIVAAVSGGDWGTITSNTTQSDSWNDNIFNQGGRSGSFTFTLAHAGSSDSYIELRLDTSGQIGNVHSNSCLSLGETTVHLVHGETVGTARIYLSGVEAGTHTVHWKVQVTGWGQMRYSVTINPPVAPPIITTHPASATYVQGTTATSLSMSANIGEFPGTLSYQWQQRVVGTTDWRDIDGATGTDYTPPTGACGAMNYRCVVTNTRDDLSHSATSNVETVTVIGTPSITQGLQTQTRLVGETATLSVTATRPGNLGTLQYRWSTDGGNTWGNWGNSSQVNVLTNQAHQTQYSVEVRNTHGGAVTGAVRSYATVTVIGAPTNVSVSISGDGSPTRSINETTTLTAHATRPNNIGTLQYRWSTDGGNTWGAWGNQNIFTVPTGHAHQTNYRVEVRNTHDSRNTSGVASLITTITVIGAPTITTQPYDAVYLAGELITDIPPSNPKATGDWGIITSYSRYTDRFNDQPGLPGSGDIKNGSFTFTLAHTGDANSYIQLQADVFTRFNSSGTWIELRKDGELVARDNGASPTISLDGLASGTYTVDWRAQRNAVGFLPIFSFHISINPPANPTIIESNGTLTVVAARPGNLGTLSYQWEERAVGTSDWNPTGGNSATMTIPTDTAHATEYRVIITNSHGDRTIATVSRTATITVVEEVPPPTDFRRTDATGHSITLSWEPPNMPSIYQPSYILQYRMSGEEGWITLSPSADATSIEIAGLERNTAYDFRIRTIHSEWATLEGITTSPLTEDEFDVLKSLYGDLELTNFANYNIIGITAHDFSLAALQHAIYTAANTRETDIIVIHTTAEHNTITLDGSELAINFDAAEWGGVIIVGFGEVPLTIDAGHQSRVFNIGRDSNVALAGLNIINGYSATSGGGILNAGTLLVSHCLVAANSSGSNGGAIHNTSTGTLSVSRSEIARNSAGNTGGGIHNHRGVTEVIDSAVLFNMAHNSGGGLYNLGGTLTVTMSEVANNWANSGGGGIYNTNSGARAGNNLIQDGILIVSGSLVSENVAGASGGGLYNLGGLVTIEENSTISNNVASASGGGIVNVVLIAARPGGGIDQAVGVLTIQHSTVSGNVAGADSTTAEHGGGIYNTARLTIEDIELVGNQTSGSGGGIYNIGTANVERSTVIYNRASVTGGGMSNIGGTLIAINSVVAKNWSNLRGAGIYNHGGVHSLTIVNCTIVGNTTESSPIGGIFCEGVNATNPATRIYNSIIAGNDGYDLEVGDLYTSNETLMTIRHSILGFVDSRFFGFVVGVNRGNQIITPQVNQSLYDSRNLFVDYANDDFRLFTIYGDAVNAINRGSLEEVPVELRDSLAFDRNGEGSNRVVGGRIDIGAYEYGALPETRSIVVTTLDDLDDPYDNLISLREAIRYAQPGDTITFADNLFRIDGNSLISVPNDGRSHTLTLVGGELYIDKSLTIDGMERFTIDAANQSRVISISEGVTVVLAGLTITRGSADNGGGIYNQGMLTVIDCRITGNNTPTNVSHFTVGGGIYNDSSGMLYVTNSTIDNNMSMYGGGIFNNFGMVSIIGSMIAGNTVTHDGGGISNGGDHTSIISIISSTISGNTAVGGGGGIYNSGGLLTITGSSTISGNTTFAGGGGISNRAGGIVDVISSTISGNRALINQSVCSAGGIFNQLGTINVIDSDILGNTAVWESGGIFNDRGTVNVIASTIMHNVAAYGGGGIYNYGGVLYVAVSTIAGNRAGIGGGIYSGGNGGSTTLVNSVIAGNSASHGGIEITNGSVSVSIVNCTIVGNLGSDLNRSSSGSIHLSNSIIGQRNNFAFSGSHNLFGTDANNLMLMQLPGSDSPQRLIDENGIAVFNANNTGLNYNPGHWNLRLQNHVDNRHALDGGNNAFAPRVPASTPAIVELLRDQHGFLRDLAGNNRIFALEHDGRVDIGAYESWFQPLAAPTNLRLHAEDYTSASLIWDSYAVPANLELVGYILRYTQAGGTNWNSYFFTELPVGPTTAHILANLTNGTQYNVELIAIVRNAQGELQFTEAASHTFTTSAFAAVSSEWLARTWIDRTGQHNLGERVYVNGVWTGYIVEAIFGRAAGHFGQPSGFYAVGIVKEMDGKREATLVFKGTDDLFDIFSDVHRNGVGWDQYRDHKGQVMNWVNSVHVISLVGHSLGGALAQWFAVDISRESSVHLKEVVTYNSTGISKSHADRFIQGSTKVTHHIVNGDWVSLAGEAFIAGTNILYTINLNHLIARHTQSLEGLDGRTISTAELNSGKFTFTTSEFRAEAQLLQMLATPLILHNYALTSLDAAWGVVKGVFTFNWSKAAKEAKRIGEATKAIVEFGLLVQTRNGLEGARKGAGSSALVTVAHTVFRSLFAGSAPRIAQTAPPSHVKITPEGFFEVSYDVTIRVNGQPRTVSMVYLIKEGEDIQAFERGLREVGRYMGNAFSALSNFATTSTPGDYIVRLNFAEGQEGNRLNDPRFTHVPELDSDTQRYYSVFGAREEISQWLLEIESVTGGTATLFEFVEELDVRVQSNVKRHDNSFNLPMLSPGLSDDAIVTIYLSGDNKSFNGIPVYVTTYGEFRANGWNWTAEGVSAGTYFAFIRAEYGIAAPTMVYFDNAITITAATPSLLASMSEDRTTVVLQWEAEGADHFTLQRRGPGETNWTTIYTGSNTEYTDTGLTGATQYQYRVQVIDPSTATALSAFSSTASPIIFLPVPVLGNVTASHTSINVTWNAVDHATGYILQYSTDASFLTGVVTLTDMMELTSTSRLITGLAPDTNYHFRVIAIGTGAYGSSVDWSDVVSATTTSIPSLPAPLNLRPIQTGQTAVSLQWNTVADAAEYILQRKGSGDADFVTIYTGFAAKFIDQGLTAETDYEYRVQAVGSAFTEPIFVTTLASTETDVPIFLDTYVNEFGQITLTWTDLGEDYTYTIFRQGQMIARDVSGTSFLDTKPPASWGVLEYSIRAFNEATQDSARMVTTIAWNTNIRPVEFTGFEITENGVQLFWDASPDTEYQIMRLGATLGRDVTSGWTDNRPMDRNDYVLMALYEEDGRLVRTYSNVFTVQWTPPSAPLVPFADEFQVDAGVVTHVPVQHVNGALTLPLDIAGHATLPDGEGTLLLDTEPEILYSALRAGIHFSDHGMTNKWFDVSQQLSNEDYTHLALYHAEIAQGAALSDNHTIDKSLHPFEFIASSRDGFPSEYEMEPDKVQKPLQRFVKSAFWR
ncbi:MAG: fibronectin type III domain-containing protein [Planctomycetaceae bacterium]|nr:fibronectin type III domain-containing protein [Planctomycetaceae bacterium]